GNGSVNHHSDHSDRSKAIYARFSAWATPKENTVLRRAFYTFKKSMNPHLFKTTSDIDHLLSPSALNNHSFI
ncbi:MAG: hypothetical protein P0S94_05190, partial [Simkaniaceae bacterium]|nr:hypothetical protein [Simkaniaceae bacterium]